MEPIRIQRKRTKGFNLQQESIDRNGLPCVYVGRPGKWGNPFQVGDFVIFPKSGLVTFWKTYKAKWAKGDYKELKTPDDVLDAYKEYLSRSKNNYSAIKGKNLACWCKEGELCHGDILLKWAND